MTNLTQPSWLDHAWADLGVLERPGGASNPRVLAYYRDAGHPEVRSDAVAWCAAFLGACLQRAGTTPTGSLLARSYLDWGHPLETPALGCIVVLSRGSDPGQGHVGFLIGMTATHLYLLGGNQSDAVRVDAFDRDRLLSLRWPAARPTSSTVPTTPPTPAPAPSLFDTALAHVFEMEGGYTEDAYDPGGPTNLGITLATFAAFKGIALTADSFAPLKSELKSISKDTAAGIYRTRYWSRCFAADLPPALGLMHFDAAVNHGVHGAAELLQRSVDVAIDGEIGPDTLAAARAQPLATTLAAYAANRLARYQSLPHFWRFGRGWTRRVERTLAAASAFLNAPLSTSKDPTMPDASTTPVATAPQTTEPKWWGHSMTIWGTIITALSTVLPAVGPLIGLDITADMVRELGQSLTQLIQALGGIVGIVLTILGRLRAVQPLMRRDVVVKL